MFAIGCVGTSFYLFEKTASTEGSIPGNFLVILTAIGLLASAAVLIAPEALRLFTRPFTSLIDAIFFPREKSPKPELSYNLPEFYAKQERYEEALSAYLTILEYYPKETRAYLGALELLIQVFDEIDEARRLYRRACRHLRHHLEELEALRSGWHRLTSDRVQC
jgi:tetratricopeptide (TPR) repeat protein